MQYSKTYVGVLIIVVGWLGLADVVSESNIAQLVDAAIVLVGIIQTVYGRYKAGGVTPLGFRK